MAGCSKFNAPLDHDCHRVAASCLTHCRGVCSVRQPTGLTSHTAWHGGTQGMPWWTDATCQLIALYSTKLRTKIRENWLLCGWRKKTSSARAWRYRGACVYRIGTVSGNLCGTVPWTKIFWNFLTVLAEHVSTSRALCLRHNWQIAV
jgi:hypothetical protein